MVRKTFLFLIVAGVCAITSACYDRREVDEFAYAIAVGMDKGIHGGIRMSLQFAVPRRMTGGSGGGGGGGGGEEKNGGDSTVLTTVETPALFPALNLINNYISRQVNLSHATEVVFSEELAREGIQKHIHSIVRNREFRPTVYIAVSKGSAEEYLKKVKTVIELNPVKYYDISHRNYAYTAFIPNSQLHTFYHSMESYAAQPVAMLVGVNKYESTEKMSEAHSRFMGGRFHFDGEHSAGNIPRYGSIEAESMGAAVFDGDRMVGELNGEETRYYLMMTGEFNTAAYTLFDPLHKESLISLSIIQNRKPRIKVRLEGDNPHISVILDLDSDILGVQSGENYESPPKTSILEDAAAETIRTDIERLLEKTRDVYKSDIFGFGNYARKYFLTTEQWQSYQWKSKYKNSTFDVEVRFHIRRSGLLIRSLPSVSTEGEKYE